MQKVKAACLQMRSGVSVLPNINVASAQIREAASNGAQLVATPEMTNLLDIRRGVEKERPVVEAEDPSLMAFRSLAGELGIWLLIGSLAIALEDERRKANRSFLIAPSGDIAARYDKINMFDVMLGDGQTYRESDAYRPGQEAVLAKTAIGAIGLTICYDLRFPQLYRTLAQSGAEILACPAAFTRVTGEAHWHALLRARAIETGAYILAPAQGGKHQDGRETYGHALIISPWGEILAEADHADPCVTYADLDLGEVVKARQRIPSLASDRPFTIKMSEF
ncbi:MAG: carbon-nitrogen hydrolase family protein [Henriciella sp.]